MKDMFDRQIHVDDTVIHVVKGSTSVSTRIARVTNVTDRCTWLQVVAGNDVDWQLGKWSHASRRREQFSGASTVCRTPANILVANGIDAAGIRAAVLLAQDGRRADINSRIK